MIDQGHTPRSVAKKSPAAMRVRKRSPSPRGPLWGSDRMAEGRGEGPFPSTHNHSRGVASAVRQKALATGPVSERRTRIGAKAIAQPPARRQRNAAVERGAPSGAAETSLMER